ncbi:hypothetical protein H6G51_08920 [Limnothrix sp. FACHB-708]|nr:hypothetical protein [Limnothrix sp. FACHB-708]
MNDHFPIPPMHRNRSRKNNNPRCMGVPINPLVTMGDRPGKAGSFLP